MIKQKAKSWLKRTFSCILASAMAASMAAVMPVTAEDNTLRTYFGDGYEVNYSIKGSWDGNQNIEVTLTNTGSESLLNWALKYDAHGEIGGLWNGTVYDSDSTKYIVKNAGYNYEILPEQEVTFGYTLTGDDLEFPETVELCSQRTERTTDGYSVEMSVMNDWDTGFTGIITIQNLGADPLEAWQLSFDTNFEITDLWNAQIIGSVENHYTVANDITTTPIGVGESKVFGFSASKESGVTPEISDFIMSEITINNDFTIVDIPDDDEIVIFAFGEYLAEDNALNIEWFTSVENGSFELMESYNNEDYTTTAVLNETYSYTYPISDDFDTRYFKVMQTTDDGRTAENAPFVVTRSDDGYSVDFLDSDSDGLEDIYEEIIGTDVNNPDTDGDGLTDYQEVYITGTDPNKYDSVTEGVSDADADPDGDGLSNAQEIELDTDPQNDDTDGDGLKDGEEVNDYHTDPLKPDTDGDGLPDGDEPHIGLDPSDPETFEVPDADFVVEQSIPAESEVFEKINTEDNAYELSLKVKTTGYAEGNVDVKESGYAAVVESDMILGVVPEISLGNTCNAEEIVLYYKISDSYIENEIEAYATENEELAGIKRLGIFTFDEEYHVLVPVPTEYDLENNTVYASIDTAGTYFLVDYEKWFEEWGIEPAANVASNYSLRTASVSAAATEYINKADIVFSINTGKGSTNTLGESAEANLIREKKYIRDLCEQLFENSVDTKIAILGYSELPSTFPSKLCTHTYVSGNNEWASDISEVDTLLAQIKVETNYSNGCLELALQDVAYPIAGPGQPYTFRDGADKFCFVVTPYTNMYTYKGWGTVDLSTLCSIKACYSVMQSKKIYTSYIMDARIGNTVTVYAGIYTGGTISSYIDDSGLEDTYDFIYDTAEKVEIDTSTKYISSLHLNTITLSAPLSIDDAKQNDTDGDGLTDWQEVLCKNGLITGSSEIGYDLPTYEEYLRVAIPNDNFNVLEDFLSVKIGDFFYDHVKNQEVLPLISDPCNEDTDQDNLPDGEEYEYKYFEGVTVGNLGLLIYTSPVCVDTDGDGVGDFYDSEPTTYNENTYDREKAVEYACTWYNSYNADEFYHGNATLNDCANFASQCVLAGGIPMDDNWYMKKMDSNSLYNRIFHDDVCLNFDDNNKLWEYSASWTANSSIDDKYKLYHPDYFSNYRSRFTKDFTTLEELLDIINNKQIQPGDLIYFCSGDKWVHVSFIDDVTDNDILMASHTNPAYDKSFISNYETSYKSAYTKFRIVCIDDVIR